MEKNPLSLASICPSHVLDLSLYDTSRPCPHCGTILDDIIGKSLYTINRMYKKNGLNEKFNLCAVCCQILTS